MKRAIAMVLACLIVPQAYAADDVSAGEVSVTPVSITEQRFRGLNGEEPRFGTSNEMEIVLRVHGPAVEKATSYGHLKIEKAVDDLGNDLKPDEKGAFSFGNEDGFTQIDSGMSGMLQKKDEPGFRLKVELKPAARKASTIQVKGTVQVLAGGKPLTVTVKNVSSLVGKQLEDPQLQEAGIQIKVLESKKSGVGLFGRSNDDGKSLPLEIKGNVSAVQEVELLDKAGKNLIQGHFTQHLKDERKVSYQLSQALDDTMTLKIQLVAGQKPVTVPFELKDVELP